MTPDWEALARMLADALREAIRLNDEAAEAFDRGADMTDAEEALAAYEAALKDGNEGA